MFSIKAVKKEGRKVLKKNIWKVIAVCFIITIVTGGTVINLFKEQVSFANDNNIIDSGEILGNKSNSDIVNDFINSSHTVNIFTDKYLGKATSGVLANVVNNVNKSNSLVFGILNSINEMIFKSRIGPGIVILIGTLFMFFYYYFISNVFIVGEARFFLENRRYKNTKINRILVSYYNKKAKKVSFAMFKKNIYNFFWYFTGVGGIIKHYSYFFVPYILAENPDLKSSEVITLSRKMTNGYKWKLFLLDLSFIGYDILGILSFNISNLVYKNPYKNSTYAEIYMLVRREYIKDKKENYLFLNDEYLDVNYNQEEYPKSSTEKKKIENESLNKITIIDVIILFFSFAFIGYVWEVLLHLFSDGIFVNRGSLYGPWLPIYGFGGLITLLLLRRYQENPIKVFFMSMLVCGVIEYCSSLFGEIIYHVRWWDYTGYFLNINGRICLEGLLVFAFACTINIYIISPFLLKIYHKVNDNILMIISFVLFCLIIFDCCFCLIKGPNHGKSITYEREAYSYNSILADKDSI